MRGQREAPHRLSFIRDACLFFPSSCRRAHRKGKRCLSQSGRVLLLHGPCSVATKAYAPLASALKTLHLGKHRARPGSASVLSSTGRARSSGSRPLRKPGEGRLDTVGGMPMNWSVCGFVVWQQSLMRPVTGSSPSPPHLPLPSPLRSFPLPHPLSLSTCPYPLSPPLLSSRHPPPPMASHLPTLLLPSPSPASPRSLVLSSPDSLLCILPVGLGLHRWGLPCTPDAPRGLFTHSAPCFPRSVSLPF